MVKVGRPFCGPPFTSFVSWEDGKQPALFGTEPFNHAPRHGGLVIWCFHLLLRTLLNPVFEQAGLVLALLGGVRKNDGVPGRMPIRGDIHVLVVSMHAHALEGGGGIMRARGMGQLTSQCLIPAVMQLPTLGDGALATYGDDDPNEGCLAQCHACPFPRWETQAWARASCCRRPQALPPVGCMYAATPAQARVSPCRWCG